MYCGSKRWPSVGAKKPFKTVVKEVSGKKALCDSS